MAPQVAWARSCLGVQLLALVGDRRMKTSAGIYEDLNPADLDYILAVKTENTRMDLLRATRVTPETSAGSVRYGRLQGLERVEKFAKAAT